MRTLRTSFRVAKKMGKRLGTGQILFRSVPERMNQTRQTTATRLTYAGILPFLFLGLATVLKLSGPDYGLALRGYGVVITSFLCGIHWAAHLFFANQCRRNLLVISNVITLIAYTSLLIYQKNIAFLIQSIGFVVLLWIDYELLTQSIIPRWYFSLRCYATAAVVFLLLTVVMLS